MNTYRVNSAKFAGFEVGDIVTEEQLDSRLNLAGLLSSGVLSLEGAKSQKKSAKVEEVSEMENANNGEDRSY